MNLYSRLQPLALALGLHGAVALAAAPVAVLDTTGFDTSVRAQDDLFEATNGRWLKATEIPADKPEYGTFIQLRDLADQRVRTIVDELAKGKPEGGSVAQKVGAFYAT